MTPQPLLQAFLQQARDHALIFLDPRGLIVGWAAGAENVFGYSAAEVEGKPLSVLFTPEDVEHKSDEYELKVAADYGKCEDDRWMLRKDRGRFWASGVVIGLRGADGELIGFSKVLRDRTDVRTQMQNLQNRVEAGEQGMRRKDELMGAFGHELRTPLTSLAFGLEILKRTGPAGANDTSDMMRRQVDFMSSVIRNILDLTRAQSGKTTLRVEKVSLVDLIARAKETCASLLEQHRHSPRVILPESDIVFEGDPTLLQQVVVNLLCNAAKFTEPPHGIWVMGTIEGHEVVVRIRDHGRGIPAEMLPHIFEIFTQAQADVPAPGAGLGIGLAVVKQLVELHGGSVTVRSEGEGLGSEFTFRVPISQSERQPGADRSNAS